MKRDDYNAFTDQLRLNLLDDERVLGLVVLGSTADRSHAPDEWSDHDFFVITEHDQQEWFRTHFDWLPDHENIVLTVRETAHGLKILYQNGHVLEFAVFDAEEIHMARVNDYAVLFDRGPVGVLLADVAARPTPSVEAYTHRDLGMVLSLLIVGAGRYARGEVLSAHVVIKQYALSHLMALLTRHLPDGDRHYLDNLDPYRRFERVFPQIGAEINTALNHDPISAALDLLDVYERHLCEAEPYSQDATSTVRAFLLRSAREIR